MMVFDGRYGPVLGTWKDVHYKNVSIGTSGFKMYKVYLKWYNDYHKKWMTEDIATITSIGHGWNLLGEQTQHGQAMFPHIEGFINRQKAVEHRLYELKIWRRDPLPIDQDYYGVCHHVRTGERIDELKAELDELKNKF